MAVELQHLQQGELLDEVEVRCGQAKAAEDGGSVKAPFAALFRPVGYPAFVMAQIARDDLQEGGFAGSVGPQNRIPVSVPEAEIQTPEDPFIIVALADVFK